MATSGTIRAFPQTADDAEAVLFELNVILSSHHFKNSKRYPALLSYVVSKALEGQTEHLKERTLGVEVFGRQPDYDTNADPIVRVTVGEIRKKIAQFYHEKGNESGIQIDLPLGSYSPEFKRLPVPQSEGAHPTLTPSIGGALPGAAQPQSPVRTARVLTSRAWWNKLLSMRLSYAIGLVAIVVAAAGFGVYKMHGESSQYTTDQFWKPLLSGTGSILAVIPASVQRAGLPTTPDRADLVRISHGPYNYISVCDAVALSRFASLLGRRSRQMDIKEAGLTSLNDLHERPALLIGAINNQWTMRLTESLRFHFSIEDPSVRIVDSQHPQSHEWMVDYTRPYAFAKRDYAIIARYKDPTTGGNLLVIAGIGAHATQAASEFVATPAELDQIRLIAPRGWENRNLEMVVATDIINGDSGPPRLLAVESW